MLLLQVNKLKSLAVFAALSFAISATSFAQAPLIVWDKTFGGTGSEFFTTMQQTSDGGIILGGYSTSPQGGMKSEPSRDDSLTRRGDYWIVKTDANGVKQWDKTFGANHWDQLNVVKQTSDGGYILGGSSQSDQNNDKSQASFGGTDGWLIKVDANGNKLWDKVYGSTLWDGILDLQQTTDGGFILGLVSHSPQGGNKTQNTYGFYDYWIVKTDAQGNIVWDKTFGGLDDDALVALQQTSDGGYILGGNSRSGINGNKTAPFQGNNDYWIVKLDANGNKVWDKAYGTIANDIFTSILHTSDGGYIIGGHTTGSGRDKSQPSKGYADFWILKLDSNGNKVWDKTIGGPSTDGLSSIKQTIDGGYVACGISYSGIGGDKTEASRGFDDFWIVKLDVNGNIQWDKTIGGNDLDQPYQILQLSDGSYLVGGVSTSDPGADKTDPHLGFGEYWLVKLTAGGTTATASEVEAAYELYQNFPNPFAVNTAIRFRLPKQEQVELLIFNSLGQVVARHQQTYQQGVSEVNWQELLTGNTICSGTYFYQITAGEFKAVKRMVWLQE
ncbi:MAG: T9SS type A sorting domain-containing protein [Hymenobacteraceae bacterium]|nr:T9SS type A sorting domain-containing protein [Hymenobacteraceae bacterium]